MHCSWEQSRKYEQITRMTHMIQSTLEEQTCTIHDLSKLHASDIDWLTDSGQGNIDKVTLNW